MKSPTIFDHASINLFRASATLLQTARLPRSLAKLTLLGLTFFDLNSEYSCHHDQLERYEGESLLSDFDVLSGVTSGRMLLTKRVERTSDFRNAPCNQSLPKVRNRNPSRRA